MTDRRVRLYPHTGRHHTTLTDAYLCRDGAVTGVPSPAPPTPPLSQAEAFYLREGGRWRDTQSGYPVPRTGHTVTVYGTTVYYDPPAANPGPPPPTIQPATESDATRAAREHYHRQLAEAYGMYYAG